MQCPSCQFHNMPGSQRCARCAASLNLQTAEIDIHPPRASRWQKAMPSRPFAWVRETGTLLSSSAGKSFSRPTESNFGGAPLEYLQLLIPGLHQILHQRRFRGWVWLSVWLTLLVLTLLTAGTGISSMLLGILFAWQVGATVDALARHFADAADRVFFTLVVGALLLMLIYLPIIGAIGRVARPVGIALTTEQFRAGEVVWYRPTTTPRVDDLVLYNLPNQDWMSRNQQFRLTGLRINRVVAVAQQEVSWHEGNLLVDGVVSAWQLRVPRNFVPNSVLTVPADHVLILPQDLLLPGIDVVPATVLQRAAIVPTRNVQGRVVLRSFPPTRIRFY